MHTGDLAEVLVIERNAHITPWSRLSFEESLNQGHLCRVVKRKGTVVAFHVICPVLDEMHILNLAIAPTLQGQGLGHVLMDDILSLAQKGGAAKLFLEVRRSNGRAQSLYRKWGFSEIAVRGGYYRFDDQLREDALVFARELDGETKKD